MDIEQQTAERRDSDWISVIAAFLVTIIVNVLADALPIAGTTTGAVSEKYASSFTPAGFTFSIWGLIYLGLAGYVTYQALPAQRGRADLAAISAPFMVSCLANAAWLVLWHLEWLLPSLLAMIVLFVALIRVYRDLHAVEMPIRERIIVRWPFSLYLGWITVALIANVSAFQAALYWNNALITGAAWTIIKLAIAASIGAVMVVKRGDAIFALVVGWAAFGIAAVHVDQSAVAGAAKTVVLMMLLLSAVRIGVFIRSSRSGDDEQGH